MAHIIDFTEARRARGLPPTPLENAHLREMARIDLAEELAELRDAIRYIPASLYRPLAEDLPDNWTTHWDDLDGDR